MKHTATLYINMLMWKKIKYHSEKDRCPAHQTLALTLSDNKHFTSWEDILQTPLTVTWFLRSIDDLSANRAAMCLSSGFRERDFSMDSHGQILITPPSAPDHRSPGSKQHEKLKPKHSYVPCSIQKHLDHNPLPVLCKHP